MHFVHTTDMKRVINLRIGLYAEISANFYVQSHNWYRALSNRAIRTVVWQENGFQSQLGLHMRSQTTQGR